MDVPSSHPAARPRPRAPWLLLAITVFAVAAPFLLVSHGKDIIDWRGDLDAALAEAKAANKQVLIDFTADWCPPCKVMKREVFSKDTVKSAIESRFIPLRIDVTNREPKADSIGRRFAVKYLPTYLVVSAEGEEVRREVGLFDEPHFIEWLSR